MDLYSWNKSARVAPSDPKSWEKYILNQQGAHSRRTRAVRRYTVEGIPSFEEFQTAYEERHNRKMGFSPADSLREQDNPSRADTPEACAFEMHDLDDDLAGSKRSSRHSSFSTTRSKHPCGSFRTASFMQSPRFSPYNSPKRTRRFNTGGDHHQHYQKTPRGSTESFEDAVRRDKARFFAQQQTSQHHNRRARAPKPSTMPKREQFFNMPQTDFPRFNPIPADLRPTTDLYQQWRDECDAQFRDKTTITSIPRPPIPACGKCQQETLMNRAESEATCIHSLESLFRAACKKTKSNSTDHAAYYKLLKEERNKWHTDRFGMCKPESKPVIERTANVLFVLINELYDREKKRLDAIGMLKKTTQTPAPASNDAFADPETKVW